MKTTKFTNGEWNVEKALRQSNNSIEIKSDKLLCVTCNNLVMAICGISEKEEAQANAKLIASAPFLFEALQGLMKTIPLGFSNEYTDLARQAIKKATE